MIEALFLLGGLMVGFILRGRPALVVQAPVEPLVQKVAELMKMRTACAQNNDCKDCKAFLQMFIEPHPDTEEPKESMEAKEPPPDSTGAYL